MMKLRLAALDNMELLESNDYWTGFAIGSAIVVGVALFAVALLTLLAM